MGDPENSGTESVFQEVEIFDENIDLHAREAQQNLARINSKRFMLRHIVVNFLGKKPNKPRHNFESDNNKIITYNGFPIKLDPCFSSERRRSEGSRMTEAQETQNRICVCSGQVRSRKYSFRAPHSAVLALRMGKHLSQARKS